MLETVVVVVRTSSGKFYARLQAKGALYSRTLYLRRFRGKRARGGQVAGAHHPGQLSRCYRCDNVTLIGRPVPLT